MIRAVLVDLSGTVHQGSHVVVPGAVEAIHRLLQVADTGVSNNTTSSPLLVRFLTNTSTMSSQQLLALLHSLGFTKIRQEHLMTSLLATRSYLQRQSTNAKALNPFYLLEDTSDFENVNGSQEETSSDTSYNCVVLGLAPSKFQYETLNQAFEVLQRYPENPLIAVHRAMYIKESTSKPDPGGSAVEKDAFRLGPGAFVTALEAAVDNWNTSAQPRAHTVIMGKPSKEFFHSALTLDNGSTVDPQEACMIGDDVIQDIHGARDAGIGTTLLVQTGKYRPGDEHRTKTSNTATTDATAQVPTKTVPSIVEAIDYVLQNLAEEQQSARLH